MRQAHPLERVNSELYKINMVDPCGQIESNKVCLNPAIVGI